MANWVIQRQRRKSGQLITAASCLGIAYLFFSLSVDRGNLFYYLLTLIFLVYFLKFTLKLIGDIIHGFRR